MKCECAYSKNNNEFNIPNDIIDSLESGNLVLFCEMCIRDRGSSLPAIGTDLDGFDGMEAMDIPDVSGMERLWDALKRKGLSERQLDKIWSGNALRVIP